MSIKTLEIKFSVNLFLTTVFLKVKTSQSRKRRYINRIGSIKGNASKENQEPYPKINCNQSEGPPRRNPK